MLINKLAAAHRKTLEIRSEQAMTATQMQHLQVAHEQCQARLAQAEKIKIAYQQNLQVAYKKLADMIDQERANAQERILEEHEYFAEELRQAKDEFERREEALLASLEATPMVERLMREHEMAAEEPIDEDLEQQEACIICWVRPRTHVLIPCGHVHMCGECSKDYHPSTVREGYECQTHCPYCKAEVSLPSMRCRK